jgi:putative hydrolase of the HAD superfamily
MRFSAALFDLDDTLHDDSLAYRRAAERAAQDAAGACGIDGAQLYAAYIARADAFWRDLSPSTLGTKLVDLRASMWTGALADCGVNDRRLGSRLAKDYNRYRSSVLELWPGVLAMLARLRAAGLKLGIVTNGFAETHRDKIAQLGLEGAVDASFMADEVGTVKPDPKFFLHAAKALDVDPATCAVVGDRYDRDVRGAHAAGMFGIWLDVGRDRLDTGVRAPDAIVTSIADVEALLLG